jgi:hypothetical protein
MEGSLSGVRYNKQANKQTNKQTTRWMIQSVTNDHHWRMHAQVKGAMHMEHCSNKHNDVAVIIASLDKTSGSLMTTPAAEMQVVITDCCTTQTCHAKCA